MITAQVRKIRRKEHRKFMKFRLSDNNPRTFWKFIKRNLKTSFEFPALISPDGTVLLNPKEKADALNQFFASQFIEDNGEKKFRGKICLHHLDSCNFPEFKVLAHLKKLRPKLSCGPDRIPNIFLKMMRYPLAKPLASLFNVSFHLGDVPQDWKKATIRPLPKTSSRSSSLKDYRPISLTSSVCKLMESIIRDELMKFCVKNKILAKEQFGFVSKKSAELQLLHCMNDWTTSADQKLPTDVLCEGVRFSVPSETTIQAECIWHARKNAQLAGILPLG